MTSVAGLDQLQDSSKGAPDFERVRVLKILEFQPKSLDFTGNSRRPPNVRLYARSGMAELG